MEIDSRSVTDIANNFDTSSGALSDVASKAEAWEFGYDQAGRNYGDLGVRIAAGFEGAESMLARWSEVSKDSAVQLRGSCAHYTSADEVTSQSLAGADLAAER